MSLPPATTESDPPKDKGNKILDNVFNDQMEEEIQDVQDVIKAVLARYVTEYRSETQQVNRCSKMVARKSIFISKSVQGCKILSCYSSQFNTIGISFQHLWQTSHKKESMY